MMFVVLNLLLLLRTSRGQFSDPDQFSKHVEWVDEGKERPKDWPIPPSSSEITFQDFGIAKKVISCNCIDFDKSMIKKYQADHPKSGQWQIELPISLCHDQKNISLGPYDTKSNALKDSGRIAAELEYCANKLQIERNPSDIPRVDFEALQIQIQLLNKQISALQQELAQCTSDNLVLVKLSQTDDLQTHIQDYLKRAAADDDSLPPQY